MHSSAPADSVSRIIRIVRAGPILERGLSAPIQRVICIGRRLAVPIENRGQITVVVVGIRLGIQQGIFSHRGAIHIAVSVDSLLRLRIGVGQKITVEIVDEGGGKEYAMAGH